MVDPVAFQDACVRAFEASQAARGFAQSTMDNGSWVLDRFLTACGRPAWEVTVDDVDRVVAGLVEHPGAVVHRRLSEPTGRLGRLEGPDARVLERHRVHRRAQHRRGWRTAADQPQTLNDHAHLLPGITLKVSPYISWQNRTDHDSAEGSVRPGHRPDADQEPVLMPGEWDVTNVASRSTINGVCAVAGDRGRSCRPTPTPARAPRPGPS